MAADLRGTGRAIVWQPDAAENLADTGPGPGARDARIIGGYQQHAAGWFVGVWVVGIRVIGFRRRAAAGWSTEWWAD